MLRETPLRAALIGVTGYGKSHLSGLRALEQSGQARLLAAAVINRSEAEETCRDLEANGCRIYPDYQSLFREERGRLDICCIPTGIAWHSRMTIDALRAGCHVLVEKPVAGTVEEVDAMIEARNEAGLQVFVGFQDMYSSLTHELKRLLLGGAIGQLQRIKIMAVWPRSLAYYTRNNWAGCLKNQAGWVYDSPANNALSHSMMAALYLAGPTFREVGSVVKLEAELYRAQPIESFDTISSRLETADGVEIYYGVTHSSVERQDPVLELEGTAGKVVWEVSGNIRFCPDNGKESVITTGRGKDKRDEMFQAIITCITSGESGGCTLEMAREHTRVINALHKHVPIHSVPESYHSKHAVEGTTQIAITDILPAMRQCFDEGKLLSDLNLPWTSQAPSRVDLPVGIAC